MVADRLEQELAYHAPVIALDTMLPYRIRVELSVFAFVITSMAAMVAILLTVSVNTVPFSIPAWLLERALPGAIGLSLVAGSITMLMLMVNAFANTRYARGLTTQLHEDIAGSGVITHEAARFIMSARRRGVREALMADPVGSTVLDRCGVPLDDRPEFLSRHGPGTDTFRPSVPRDGVLTFADIAEHVFDEDDALLQFLREYGVQKETFSGALSWVRRATIREKYNRRWWSRDYLSDIPGIGTQWSYGAAYTVHDFERALRSALIFDRDAHVHFVEDTCNELEHVLAGDSNAHALLVGETGSGVFDVLWQMRRRIQRGTIAEPLRHHQVVLLDTERIAASAESNQAYQALLNAIFDDAADAGNVILVLPDYPALVSDAGQRGVSVPEIIERYNGVAGLHIVAITGYRSRQQLMEQSTNALHPFTDVHHDPGSITSVVTVLERHVEHLEEQTGVVFTYPALRAVVEDAQRFWQQTPLPEAALSLLEEVPPRAAAKQQRIIQRDFVHDLVEEKTGMPLGSVDDTERELLMNLGSKMQERVVGQDAALEKLAQALRRARTNIQDRNRPLASFLFLGPTGVGKTETARTLTDMYFQGSEFMQRLDMSEFQGSESLAQLIGSSETGTSGRLTEMVAKQQYGILLLDEFEKASANVQNVFLQILEDGFFTSGHGERYSARNFIVIATSNAGSDYIYEHASGAKDFDMQVRELVDIILRNGTFPPELINRFDDVILFAPLDESQVRQVVKLEIAKALDRIDKKGIDVTYTKGVVDVLAQEGYDPDFGARPLRRVVQSSIEQLVADRLVSGDVSAGDSIRITKRDIEGMV
jgi:ATP-dependent Clp protease ATP-binding subunit ClpC